MSPDKDNLAPEVQEAGFLASLKKAVPGAGAALTILSLATASKVADAATATVESLPEPLNSIVNDGVNHTVAFSENECGDVAFKQYSPDFSSGGWHVLNAGATEAVSVPGNYSQLNPVDNCDFIGADQDGGAIWRLPSTNNWDRGETPVLAGIDQDGDGHLDPINADFAWNESHGGLMAYTDMIGLATIKDASGDDLINDGLYQQSNPDFDPNWHVSGRYVYTEQVTSRDPIQIRFKSADDLSGDSTFVAEGIWPALTPDGTAVNFSQLNPSTGLYEGKRAVLPITVNFYCDSDGDGHGDINHPFEADFDTIPAGETFFIYQGVRYVASSDDCDDNRAAHILPTDCNPEVEDTDTPDDTVDTPDDTEDTVDTEVDDTVDTENTGHGNLPEVHIPKGCEEVPGGSGRGWLMVAGALAAATRRSTKAERRP